MLPPPQEESSSILDEVSPAKREGTGNHIAVLVSMLNEKNKYIRQLHKKIDKLNDMIASPSRQLKVSPATSTHSRDGVKRTKSQQTINGKKKQEPMGKKKGHELSMLEDKAKANFAKALE